MKTYGKIVRTCIIIGMMASSVIVISSIVTMVGIKIGKIKK